MSNATVDSGHGHWDHSRHYHRLVLGAVPAGALRALDVGCGEGALARDLAGVVAEVIGLDIDAATVARARSLGGPPGLSYVEADVLGPRARGLGQFDLVCSMAALHHMPAAQALEAMASLVGPGGRLVVVDVARSSAPFDFVADLAGVAANRYFRWRRGWYGHQAPKRPPSLSYGQVRDAARRALPGVAYRRHLLFRYSLTWAKPTASRSDLVVNQHELRRSLGHGPEGQREAGQGHRPSEHDGGQHQGRRLRP